MKTETEHPYIEVLGSLKENYFGNALIAEGLISQEQLNNAINLQKDKEGSSEEPPLTGQLLIELGYASEEEIIAAINSHFDISAKSLNDDIEKMLRIKNGSFLPSSIKLPRMPIWLQLAITTTVLLAIVILFLSMAQLDRQKTDLYEQTTKIGTVSLNYFTNNARIPLINNNILQLNILLNEATSVEGILYAFIVDNDNKIIAHTDPSKIDKTHTPIANQRMLEKKGDISSFNYTSDTNTQILNISRAIIFKNKALGNVHVGISIDFIETVIQKRRSSIIIMAALIISLGIIIAALLGWQFSRPISRLVSATKKIAEGNYRHKVYLTRNDELGDLASSFNNMSEELWLKGLMENSFGKYVGDDVLKMITDNPNESWLRGKSSQVAVIFTDIRGFTSHCENTDAEEVVEQLNQCFSIISEVIVSHGGYVDKFIGDAVLGVFGVPVYHEDYIERAVKASMCIQKELYKAYHATKTNPLLIRNGIGLNAGIAVSGNIGSQVKMEYTVIGDAVNVASRLNSLAGDGEVIISAGINEQLNENLKTEALPPCKLKGKTELVETFKVLSMKGLD